MTRKKSPDPAGGALRDAPRETEAARREAQREIEVAGRDKGSTARTSALERAAAKVDQVAAKVDSKLAAEAAKQERLAAKAEMHVAKLDRLSGFLGTLEVWTRAETRGRRPRFTREDIAETAIRIADEEGIDALSMRHLAAELGAGTMTLYHYVRTKDELLTLVNDAVMGEVVLPADELPADWRGGLTAIANRTKLVVERHPWMFDVTDDPPIGPNSVRHFDQSLQAVSPLQLPMLEKLDIVSCVDEYVFGYCLHQRNNNSHDDGEAFPDEMKDYVDGLIATGQYPQLALIADEMGLDDSWTRIAAHLGEPSRFDRNLGRILDGIEAGLPPGALPA